MEEQYKAQGNEKFAAGDYRGAVDLFSKAIELDSKSHILFSNRSACYASLREYSSALEDAERSISLRSDWAKAYSRKGAALQGLGRLSEALDSFRKGLSLDPESAALRAAIQSCEEEVSRQERSFQNPFASEQAKLKLRTNPKTAHLMNDPVFLRKLDLLEGNPNALSSMIQDRDVMAAFGVLLGVDLQSQGPSPHEEEDCCKEKSGACCNEEARREKAPEQKPEPQKQKSAPVSESDAEKERGNVAYKSHKFSEAMQHYERALQLDEKNIPVITNIAAVHFEEGRYDACIQRCKEAIARGRELRIDFSFVARAFARIGHCYLKLEKYPDAIENFKNSITEHRNPEVVTLLKQTEKTWERLQEESYRDPKIAEAERVAGNDLFKESKFADAIARYNEAIKRNDKDAKTFANRAACFIKLGAFPDALRDCDKALELDPTFIKAYIRKANILMIKRDFAECIGICQKALSLDPENAEVRDQLLRAQMELSAMGAEADPTKSAQDPEIRSILGDPAMQVILEQMQSNPHALTEHMKNPAVATKIRKLMAAGIIKLR